MCLHSMNPYLIYSGVEIFEKSLNGEARDHIKNLKMGGGSIIHIGEVVYRKGVSTAFH